MAQSQSSFCLWGLVLTLLIAVAAAGAATADTGRGTRGATPLLQKL